MAESCLDPPGHQFEEEGREEDEGVDDNSAAPPVEQEIPYTLEEHEDLATTGISTGPAFKDQCRSMNEERMMSDDQARKEIPLVRAALANLVPTAQAVQIFEASLPNDLLCPISGSIIQDPVVLFPYGVTYDKQHLCRALLNEPHLDPLTRRRFHEKASYCNNLLVQRTLKRQEAYKPYDDGEFQKQYNQAWARQIAMGHNNQDNPFGSGTNTELYERVAALMFGLNRCQIDYESAFAFIESSDSEDAIMVAFKAWFLDPSFYICAVSCHKDKALANEMWRKADDLGLTQLAEQGNPWAQSMEARRQLLYLKNNQNFLDWLHKAADQGHTLSKQALGWVYLLGRNGQEQDLPRALSLNLQTAECGHAAAQTKLGVMYLRGLGVTKNKTIAVEYFRKAAEQGDNQGQFNLAWMYQHGCGISKDLTAAAYWYGKAADQGHLSSLALLGRASHRVTTEEYP